jgi:hypothetical protein
MSKIIEAANRFNGRDARIEAIAGMVAEEIMARVSKNAKPVPVFTSFEIGAEYGTSFACDSDSFAFFKIVGRTPKQIKFVGMTNGHPDSEVKRVKLFSDSEGEYFLPFGSYSMAMLIRAKDDKIEKE